jgi:hypothetical protein
MVTFWQWHEKRVMTDTEFVQYGRDVYGDNVPTFRNALRDLFRSMVRQRILCRAIPDVQTANDYLNGRELLATTLHNGVELYLEYERQAGYQGYKHFGPNEPTEDETETFYSGSVPWEVSEYKRWRRN